MPQQIPDLSAIRDIAREYPQVFPETSLRDLVYHSQPALVCSRRTNPR